MDRQDFGFRYCQRYAKLCKFVLTQGIEKEYINKAIWEYYRPGVLAASAVNVR